jgi:hypothetical protein
MHSTGDRLGEKYEDTPGGGQDLGEYVAQKNGCLTAILPREVILYNQDKAGQVVIDIFYEGGDLKS